MKWEFNETKMHVNFLKKLSSFRISKPFVLIFICLTVGSNILIAQENAFKPYEVENLIPEDFTIENDLVNENTKALYLFDLGRSIVDINTPESILKFTRSFRIKILSEQGLELADQIVELYVGSRDEEKIGKVKGGVYNLENGEIEFEKLKNRDWLVEESDATTKRVRMRFKNVKVGSIIDLTYTTILRLVLSSPSPIV